MVRKLVTSFSWSGPIGISFPGVVADGVARTAANLDPSWIGLDVGSVFGKAAASSVSVYFSLVGQVPVSSSACTVSPMAVRVAAISSKILAAKPVGAARRPAY